MHGHRPNVFVCFARDHFRGDSFPEKIYFPADIAEIRTSPFNSED